MHVCFNQYAETEGKSVVLSELHQQVEALSDSTVSLAERVDNVTYTVTNIGKSASNLLRKIHEIPEIVSESEREIEAHLLQCKFYTYYTPIYRKAIVHYCLHNMSCSS